MARNDKLTGERSKVPVIVALGLHCKTCVEVRGRAICDGNMPETSRRCVASVF